uniref:Uncharacterized protein n=1 Tax=Oryza meridionalis TaxID=40149 RepID=A0A0E0E4L9_9ORYZ
MARIMASCIGYVHLCLVFFLPSGVQNRSTCDILNRSLWEENKDLRTTILTIKYIYNSVRRVCSNIDHHYLDPKSNYYRNGPFSRHQCYCRCGPI